MKNLSLLSLYNRFTGSLPDVDSSACFDYVAPSRFHGRALSYGCDLFQSAKGMAISSVSSLYDLVVRYPLFSLYFNGPAVHGFGFWQGLPPETICSSLTGTPEAVWVQMPHDCYDILWRHFNSFHILVQALLYFYIIYKLAVFLYIYCCFVPFFIRRKRRNHKHRVRYLTLGQEEESD
jgi:hypothetical protein